MLWERIVIIKVKNENIFISPGSSLNWNETQKIDYQRPSSKIKLKNIFFH